jgi:hypothetical protein
MGQIPLAFKKTDWWGCSSYTGKHALEDWREHHGKPGYISNGDFIAAMILLGFKYDFRFGLNAAFKAEPVALNAIRDNEFVRFGDGVYRLAADEFIPRGQTSDGGTHVYRHHATRFNPGTAETPVIDKILSHQGITGERLALFWIMMGSLLRGYHAAVVVCGKAGTGKTVLLDFLRNFFMDQNVIYLGKYQRRAPSVPSKRYLVVCDDVEYLDGLDEEPTYFCVCNKISETGRSLATVFDFETAVPESDIDFQLGEKLELERGAFIRKANRAFIN